ncbi:MAG: choice-of-anchor D domain-containing protein [Candidatus Acidiferrales bacterium]
MKKILTGSFLFLAAVHVVNAQTPQSFVFVAEPKTHTIDAFAITPVSGALTLVPGSPFAAPNESICTAAPGCSTTPPSIATNSDATLLFSANYASSSISVFSIATSGAPAEIAGSPFPIPDAINPSVLTVSPNGQSLYVGSSFASSGPNGMLDEFAIASNGSLSFVTSASAPIVPVGIYVHPSGQFVYVYGGAGVDGATIQGFSAQNATLTPLTPLQENETPSALVGDVAGTFLYTAWSDSDSYGHIDSVAIGSDGALSVSSSFSNHVVLLSITNLALGGSFLFTNENTYSISDGVLTPINTEQESSVPIPLAASASFLFEGDQALGQGNGPLISSFVIGSNGAVTNATPALNLSGVPTALFVATSTNSAPVAPAFVFNPDSPFNFNPVADGQSLTGQIQVFSTGNATLTINSISVSGDPSFSQTNNCPAALTPSETCNIEVTFAPTAVGTFSASLNLAGNVSGALALTGTGTAASTPNPPTITVAPQSQSGQPGGTFVYTVASDSSQLSVSCATIPAATCSVSKGVVSVQTTAASASSIFGTRWLLTLGLSALALICLPRRARRAVLCATALAVCGACGGSGSASKPPVVTGTPAGTYTVSVIATAGSLQTTDNVQLVIQ